MQPRIRNARIEIRQKGAKGMARVEPIQFVKVLYAVALPFLASCADNAETLGSSAEPIVNGNPVVGSVEHFVTLSGCSGVAIRNRWILTASHCFTEGQVGNPSGINIYQPPGFPGTVASVADFVLRAPALDVALVRTRSPLSIAGSTTGFRLEPYEESTADLVGDEVSAYGFGPTSCDGSFPAGGGLRSARMEIYEAWNSAGIHVTTGVDQFYPDRFRMRPLSPRQTPIQGDSGGPILHGTGPNRRLIGTINRAAGVTPGLPDACLGGYTEAQSVNGYWPWVEHVMTMFEFGTATATGDFDGDGNLELAIGDPEGGNERSGRVHIVDLTISGGSTFTQQLDQSPFPLEAGDRFGAALAAGDFDRDGRSDLVVGLPGKERMWDRSSTGAGYIHLYRGTETGLSFVRRYGQRLPESDEAGDQFGATLVLGDFDSDGNLDLAVGAPTERQPASPPEPPETMKGAVFVLTCDGTASFICTQRWILRPVGQGAWQQFGFSLAVGDFDGDSDQDLAVGAPAADLPVPSGRIGKLGRAYVFWNDSGLGTAWGILDQPPLREDGDMYGYALAAGNFLPGAADDLAVGAPGEAPFGGATRSGWVNIWQGSASGLTYVSGLGQDGADSDERDDFFGSVMWGGALMESPLDQLAIGAPFEAVGTIRAGHVYLAAWTTGTTLRPYWVLGQEFVTASTHEMGDFYGGSITGGVGRRFANDPIWHHIIVGVPGELRAGSPAGAVHVSAPHDGADNLAWVWGPP